MRKILQVKNERKSSLEFEYLKLILYFGGIILIVVSVIQYILPKSILHQLLVVCLLLNFNLFKWKFCN